MGEPSADGACFCLHSPELKTAPFKYTAVGVIHILIFPFGILLGCMEGIGVLHYEFPAAHKAEPRPYLIPELGLYLVNIQRKLPVGTDFFPDHIGYDLFVRGSETEIPLVPVLYPEEFLAVGIPSAAFLPQLRGDDHGHCYLLRTRHVHLFTYNIFHLADYPQAKRKIVVYPCRHLSYHAGPYHKPVAYNLCIRRGLFKGWEEESGETH